MAYGLGVAKGMLTTISHLVRAPVTIQYPEERLDMPIWTRGRPRLIYEVDTGELRCTACGACALACPVDVIKIEQHPSPIKGKVLDRFDIDMAGCIECALCVEACPFRAITMAPDFEMAAFERTRDLVFDMYQLRIAGTAEIDAGMEHIQGATGGGAGRPGRRRLGGRCGRPSGGANDRGGADRLRPAHHQRRGPQEAAARRPRQGVQGSPRRLRLDAAGAESMTGLGTADAFTTFAATVAFWVAAISSIVAAYMMVFRIRNLV